MPNTTTESAGPTNSSSAQACMDWGVHLPHLGKDVSRDALVHFAQSLERLGCHSGWVSDHVCWPDEVESKYPYTHDGSFAMGSDTSWLDPIGTQLFVAGVTTTLRLGFSVLILPYRPPVATAKQLASLDVLSAGRLILGAGIGWMAEEAAILGMPWDHRGKRTDEQLQIFQTLFNDATPEFHGEFYQLPPVGFEPKPVQNPLPIWIGGSSEAAFRRAGQYGTGFHAAFQPIDLVAAEFARVQWHAAAFGRDPAALTLSLRVFLDPARAMEPDKSIGGSRDEMQERVGQLRAAGITHVLLDPVARGGVAGRLDAVADFMETSSDAPSVTSLTEPQSVFGRIASSPLCDVFTMITIPSPSMAVNDVRYPVRYTMDYNIRAAAGTCLLKTVRNIATRADLGGPAGLESLVLAGHGRPGVMQLGEMLTMSSVGCFRALRGKVNKIWIKSCEVARIGASAQDPGPRREVRILSSGGPNNGHDLMRALAINAGCYVVASTEIQTSAEDGRVYPLGFLDGYEGLVVCYNQRGILCWQRRYRSVTHLNLVAGTARAPNGE